LRTVALRNCEIEVHTASNITDAGRLWAAHSYDLVLLSAQENSDEAAVLCSAGHRCALASIRFQTVLGHTLQSAKTSGRWPQDLPADP
jgi:hypothetical protein